LKLTNLAKNEELFKKNVSVGTFKEEKNLVVKINNSVKDSSDLSDSFDQMNNTENLKFLDFSDSENIKENTKEGKRERKKTKFFVKKY
jgi:hypothetical protein